MKIKARFFIPFAALLLASPAMAQTKYRFEAFAAVNIPQDKHFEIGYPQTTVPMKATYEFSPGGRGGVRFGADFMNLYGETATELSSRGLLALGDERCAPTRRGMLYLNTVTAALI